MFFAHGSRERERERERESLTRNRREMMLHLAERIGRRLVHASPQGWASVELEDSSLFALDLEAVRTTSGVVMGFADCHLVSVLGLAGHRHMHSVRNSCGHVSPARMPPSGRHSRRKFTTCSGCGFHPSPCLMSRDLDVKEMIIMHRVDNGQVDARGRKFDWNAEGNAVISSPGEHPPRGRRAQLQ